MANAFLTDDIISLEALSILENTLVAGKIVDRSKQALFNKGNGSAHGDTVRVRKPNRAGVRSGRNFSADDATDEYVSFQVGTQIGSDFQIFSDEMAQSLSSFSQQVLQPKITVIANAIDQAILDACRQTYNLVGTPGTAATTDTVYLSAGVKLDQNACPRDGQRYVITGPQGQADIVHGLSGFFNNQNIVGKQYETGEMGSALGFKFYMDQNVGLHTVGVDTGTPLVNGATQTGASLVTDGWTNSTAGILKQNDVFTLAGVFGVNPVSKVSTGVLQQFRATADVASGASTGPATISIEPPIVTSGPMQTVTASPADNAAITVVGTAATAAANHIAIHKGAVTLAFAELPKPEGVDMSSTKTDKQLGISLRFVRWYDGSVDSFKARFDVKYGVKVLRPEWICRIAGSASA